MLKLPLAAFALWCAATSCVAQAPVKVAYFGFVLVNTSQEPTRPDEEARRAVIEARLAETLAESGRFDFVDTASVADRAALYSNLAHCNGCDAAFAKELGANLALSAEIQKTSNLILHISIYLRDAETGDLVGGGSADIRGNTDQSWRRGVDYIVKNRILNR